MKIIIDLSTEYLERKCKELDEETPINGKDLVLAIGKRMAFALLQELDKKGEDIEISDKDAADNKDFEDALVREMVLLTIMHNGKENRQHKAKE